MQEFAQKHIHQQLDNKRNIIHHFHCINIKTNSQIFGSMTKLIFVVVVFFTLTPEILLASP
jgi:hypothetical protein